MHRRSPSERVLHTGEARAHRDAAQACQRVPRSTESGASVHQVVEENERHLPTAGRQADRSKDRAGRPTPRRPALLSCSSEVSLAVAGPREKLDPPSPTEVRPACAICGTHPWRCRQHRARGHVRKLVGRDQHGFSCTPVAPCTPDLPSTGPATERVEPHRRRGRSNHRAPWRCQSARAPPPCHPHAADRPPKERTACGHDRTAASRSSRLRTVSA